MSRTPASDFPYLSETTPPSASDWAEMLARLGEKHARLSRAATRLPGGENRRPGVLSEIEKERGRIARELHAGAGQPLAGIKMNLDLLEVWCRSNPANVPQAVNDAVVRIHVLADAALGQIRAVSHRLHPPDWQNLSITSALTVLVRQSGVADRCRTNLQIESLPREPDHGVRVVLYRCAQECISNVLRHSGASHFSMTLTSSCPPAVPFGADMVHLTVRDDGRGIPEDALKRGGIGLPAIREHTRSVGGICRISSGVQGTTIQVSVPFAED